VSILSQRSLAGGEISPSLYSRTDINKYATALRTQRNFITMKSGGIFTRPGSGFVGEIKDSTKVGRLIPFKLSATQSYILEFGNLSIRFIKNGSYIKETAKNITAITKASPGVITSATHGYTSGDEIYISGIVGMTELNGRNFRVTVINANTYSLTDLGGTAINTSSYTTYSSGGTTERIYKLTTTYVEADLPLLKYSQPNGKLYITNHSYVVRTISRTSDTNWAIADAEFVSIGDSLSPSVANIGAAGTTTYRYIMEGQTADGFKSGGDPSSFSTTTGNATLDTTNYNKITWNTATSIYPFYYLYKQDPKSKNYGFIGFVERSQGTNGFLDTGVTPDQDDIFRYETFPLNDYAADGSIPSSKPSCSSLFQQRMVFANSDDKQNGVSASRIGFSSGSITAADGTEIYFFGTDSVIASDNAIHFSISGKEFNIIRHLLDIGALIIFTDTGEWVIRGSLAADSVPNLVQVSNNGSIDLLPPLAINNSAVYVQARSGAVRDLGFDFNSDNFNGIDLTDFASHLLENNQVISWTYQKLPHSNVWAVRDDGVLLCLTYIKDQQIFAWSRHDTGRPTGTVTSGRDTGECFYEDVCCIPEGDEDVVYMIVKRPVNNGARYARYVERMSTIRQDDVKDETILDSFLSYDGRNQSVGMTLTGGTNWTYDEDLTLTAGSSFFTSADVGNEIRLHYFETNSTSGEYEEHELRLKIFSYTSATVVKVHAHKTVPTSLRGVAVAGSAGLIDKAVDEVSGLWHLEGHKVSILGDGFVVGNPYNPNVTEYTVTNGAITLDKPYSVIHVGLPILADVETLDVDTADGKTIVDKKSIITSVAVRVEKTRGLFAGAKPPAYPKINAIDGLYEFKIRENEDYDSPVDQVTQVIEVPIDGTYSSGGRTFLRNIDPLPVTINAIHPAGMFPFGGG